MPVKGTEQVCRKSEEGKMAFSEAVQGCSKNVLLRKRIFISYHLIPELSFNGTGLSPQNCMKWKLVR